jgi:leader peptidase (prepilin peptidase)/N-methyltransferase
MVNFILMILIGVMLFAAGVIDMRRLIVSRVFILSLLAVCVVAFFTQENPNILTAVSGTLVGICILGISMLSGEQLGKGDGLVIAALGVAVGFRGCLVVVCIASVIMSFIALCLLAFKKGNRKTRLPFIPAIFAGYSIFLINNFCNVGVRFL